ncbi:DUF1236 domain-containing protein [Pseudaminobacter sp. NGMCC 1.201702]|uniref:DUF1236 domain-containing protein n=1 Tax=Pseudaminobacter sp. NGMCC 1.201702 TaxID=3391825 RepID=UPI0039EE315F
MKSILIKTAVALALGIAPGVAFGQTEVIKKKTMDQTEGQTTAPAQESEGASPDGATTGEQTQSGGTESGTSGSATGQSSSDTDAGATGGATTGQDAQGQSTTGEQPAQTQEGGEQGGTTGQSTQQGTTEGGATTGEPAESGQEATTPTQEESSGTAASEVNVTVEQKTEIRQVITEADVEPVPSVDFEVNVGTAVPQTITLHPLPPRIVELVPAYQGYVYFLLADGRIIIVDPDSHEIVLIIV